MHDLVRTQCLQQRFLVVDHDASWGHDSVLWRGQPPVNLYVIEEHDFQPWAEKSNENWPEKGVFAFRNVEPWAIANLVVDLGDSVYVDDELDLTARAKGWLQSPLRKIVHQGRHLKNREGDICMVHILGACRRPQNLHTDVSTLADAVYIFRVQGRRTIDRLKDDSMIEEGHVDKVRQLPTFHFLHWPSMRFFCVGEIKPAAAAQPEREPEEEEEEPEREPEEREPGSEEIEEKAL